MSVTDTPVRAGAELSPLAWRRAWLGIDANPRAIAFAQTPAGTFAVLAGVVAAMGLSGQVSTASLGLIALTLAAIAIAPARRLAIVTLASVFYVLMRPYRIDGWAVLNRELAAGAGLDPMALQMAAVTAFLALAVGFLAWQRVALQRHVAAKRPVLTLIVLWFGLFGAALLVPAGGPVHAFFWTLTGVAVSCIWFLAYAAADQKTRDATPMLARVGLMRPFWGGSATPIGKGYGYLNKFDARNAEDLAVTRLKALKLAVWALILTGLWQALDALVYRQAGLLPLNDAVLAHAGGAGQGVFANWASVLANYFIDLIIIAVWGHFIVAAIRFTGFRIPRNTANPLVSRSIAEFWNRYFFYFKELLVDFFFYPAFLRWFKTAPKLRIAFATLCAAGLGNFLYHFMRETHVFAARPVEDALAVFPSAVFYSLVLACGLIASQLRKRKPSPEDGFLAWHVWPRLNVLAFFCFLKIFDDITGQGTLTERAVFTLSLFGV